MGGGDAEERHDCEGADEDGCQDAGTRPAAEMGIGGGKAVGTRHGGPAADACDQKAEQASNPDYGITTQEGDAKGVKDAAAEQEQSRDTPEGEPSGHADDHQGDSDGDEQSPATVG